MSQVLMGKYTRIFKLSITTKVVQLVAEDPNRVCLFVYNNSSGIIYILSAQNQASTDGIPVAANGGTYKSDTTTAALWIVGASDGLDVRVEVDGC